VPLTLVETPAADAAELVRGRRADAVLLRLPVDRTGLHAIPLYSETTVVVAPKLHFVSAADEVTYDDLSDEVILRPLDDTLDWARPPGAPAGERPSTTGAAIELVAAGAGLLVIPRSLALSHHRKDLIFRPLVGAPESRVALSWLEEETTDLMEQFIGIVRGRTVNSTRGRQPAPAKAKRRETEPRKPTVHKQAAQRRSTAPKSAKRGKPRRRS
jgi:DNA-binding transcriptional LysR family regulator